MGKGDTLVSGWSSQLFLGHIALAWWGDTFLQ